MSPTIKGPITIGPDMTDADREKLRPYVSLGGLRSETEVSDDEALRKEGMLSDKPFEETLPGSKPEFSEFTEENLLKLNRKQQNELCKELGMKKYSRLREDKLIKEILKRVPKTEKGFLEKAVSLFKRWF